MKTNDKRRQAAYWVTTGLLTAGMLSGGICQVMRISWNVNGMLHLGYPLYFMTLLGIWKILGVTALLLPGLKLVKEWAYAGFFFVMTGAVISHLVSGDGVQAVIAQTVFVVLVVLSWWLRPANRRLDKPAEIVVSL
ncbi:DoxX family protein [Chitinophaga sp. HK235]|uniref:DoxX family protein n=1 Tax=Chitinophaga sp. HK235 TaxID=2952571 RepID=UPI001BAA2982|nr:DoxX family protein [Chitinophaga sp. HK235]